MTATAVDDSTIFVGSGNVFQDLELSDPDVRLAKVVITRIIEGIITSREWTQRKAASVLGIATSDMSDLMNGKLKRFSLERLERFLVALDMDVRIRIAPRKARSRQPTMSVHLVASF